MALKVGIPLYEGFDSLDVTGPFQTFTFAGMECHLIGPSDASGPVAVTSFEGIRVTPDKTFENCPRLDVLFVPGGSDPVSVLTVGHPGSNPYLDFLIRQAEGTQLWMTTDAMCRAANESLAPVSRRAWMSRCILCRYSMDSIWHDAANWRCNTTHIRHSIVETL